MLINGCAIKLDESHKDLDFIYKLILDNHPCIYNKVDPNFFINFHESYVLAKAKIQCSNDNNYLKRNIIDDFISSFNDSHLRIQWLNNINKTENADAKFTINNFLNQGVWITIPSFNLNSNQEKDFTKIVKNIVKSNNIHHIVFDLRNNQGGNSEYGSQIVDALFGEKYANQKRCYYNQNIFVDWGASNDNLAHISSLSLKHPKSTWLKNVEYGLQQSLYKKEMFYREYLSQEYKKPEFDIRERNEERE